MGLKLSRISYKMGKHEKKRGYVVSEDEDKKNIKSKRTTLASQKRQKEKQQQKDNESEDKTSDKDDEKPGPSTRKPIGKNDQLHPIVLSKSSSNDSEIDPSTSNDCDGAQCSSKSIPKNCRANDNFQECNQQAQSEELASSADSNPKGSKKFKPFSFKAKGKGFSRKDVAESCDQKASSLPEASSPCICTKYRRSSSEGIEDDGQFNSGSEASGTGGATASANHGEEAKNSQSAASRLRTPNSMLRLFNPEDYPIEDEDEKMRRQRAKEMEEGVELSDKIGALSLKGNRGNSYHHVHTQVDFIHCLVPDLKEITSCSFYWGKIDRYEAERLLEGKPEGTFLLRDSAQEEYLFSVSFRRYGRSLHARIEQWNHSFSFDAHDPSVFSAPTVTGLIEHYKDPSCCMFFEPMLTIRLHRNFTFSLEHLARSVICNQIKYDDVNQLPLPRQLKSYCREYHYKQRVRVRTFAD